jgi:uncharacterized protein YggE
MKKLFLILALFTLCSAFKAQDAKSEKPFIEVTGTSETEVTPDEIYITITLQERLESKEKITIDKQEEDLKSNLKELGIDLKDLTLNTANADFRKMKKFTKKDLVASKSYVLKVKDADMVDKVYKRLDKIDAFDAYISKLNHSNIIELTKENRKKAVKAAKEKVEYLLVAVGNTAGAPVSIVETVNAVESNPYNYYYRGAYGGYANNVAQSMNSSSSYDSGGNDGDDISMKKIKLRSSFLVRYEIAK